MVELWAWLVVLRRWSLVTDELILRGEYIQSSIQTIKSRRRLSRAPVELLGSVRRTPAFSGSPFQEKVILVDTFGCCPPEITEAPKREHRQGYGSN
jgi:hypothetical protein